jgi:transcription elongation factor Elf1
MHVNPRDGVCRSCNGPLRIVDVDDATMTLDCMQCGDSYNVEPDALGDGCMIYYVQMMAERMVGE